MQSAMKSDVLFFLCLAAFLGTASGLTVGHVRIVDNRRYIPYTNEPSANTSLIECPYQLNEGEKVLRVYWEMWDGDNKVGTYEWHHKTGGQATGRLEGMVELSRDDGDLELTKLKYNLSAKYSCAVTLTNNEMKTSSKEEVLIIDICGIGSHAIFFQRCRVTASYDSSAIFPEPTLRAGLVAANLDRYHKEVSAIDWLKLVYPNGSVAYSYNDVVFEIDENTPDEIVYEVRKGVTKSDGTYISLGSSITQIPSWDEVGCHDVKEKDNKEVNFFPGKSATCRGGRNPTTRATVTCKRGYQPKGPVTIVVMRCNGTSRTWQPEEGQTATFEDLTCVEDNDNGGNKGIISNGNPSLALLSASLSGVMLLLLSFSSP